MTKITIVKNYRGKETLRVTELEEVVRFIQTSAYAEAVDTVRGISLVTALVRQKDGSVTGADSFTEKVPRVCFATEMENRKGQRIHKGYTGLVLLEVNNLTSYEEAVAIRQSAGLMPQTLLAFVGASGRSVKIVCRGELFGGGMPEDEEAISHFHLNLYEKARLAYNAQLGVTIDKLEPGLERTCYLSADAQIVYVPDAVAFYTDASELEKAMQPLHPKGDEPHEVVPGHSRYHAMRLIYEYNLAKAYDDVAGIEDGEEQLLMTLTRLAEYRMRTGLGFSFQDLTEEARNSITIHALSQGVKCWDKDIRRYVNSNNIALYDPMYDFLEHLPRWDGKDRVEALALRVKTAYEAWPRLFHIWMRSMVAMWMGKGQLTGNALVPLLIGRQGCGKSSFCRILLPRDMREYYNDRINFKNESDLNLGLTSFALINLDEFDSVTQRQQVVLKYLVSTADLKYRPPYGKAYASHRRYASFIGTTNEPMPLVDPTGSRRFICVGVEGDIDFETRVEYDQLYAQLKYEIEEQRERYFLTKEEEKALMRHNLRYQKISGLGEMLLSLFEKPEGTPDDNPQGGCWVSVKDISARLKKAFRGAYQPDGGTLVKIGQFLSRPEYKFESARKTSGWFYWVKER